MLLRFTRDVNQKYSDTSSITTAQDMVEQYGDTFCCGIERRERFFSDPVVVSAEKTLDGSTNFSVEGISFLS